MHFSEIILNEIAVQGLEGICLEQLWVNLSDKNVNFPWDIDEISKSFLWSVILKMNYVEMYINPHVVCVKPLFNRLDCLVDTDSGVYFTTPVCSNFFYFRIWANVVFIQLDLMANLDRQSILKIV